jgi:enoyl-CoA hydratase
MRVARRLAGLPAQAVQGTKRAVNLHVVAAVARVLDYAIAAETRSITSPEHHERVREVLARHARGTAPAPGAGSAPGTVPAPGTQRTG